MKLTIGFSRPRAWFKPGSWAIRMNECTPYSHVYVRWMTSVGVEVVYQASHSMVNFMSKANFDKEALIIEEYEVEVEPEQYKALLTYCLSNAGTGYGVKQIIGMSIQRIFGLVRNPFADGKETQVCSELVGTIIKNYLGVDEVADLDAAGPKLINQICARHFKQISV
jgi:hypothetical protein